MMRYLGWGIGHHNPPNFAHEANALVASSSDRELKQYYKNPNNDSEIQPTMAEDDEWEGGESSNGMGGSDSDPESITEVVTYEF